MSSSKTIKFDVVLLQARMAERNIEVLTTEGKILLFLSDVKSATVKETMLACSNSYRGFYLSFHRLKETGVLKVEASDSDKRSRKISISEEFLRDSA